MDAFDVKASTCDLVALGERLRAAREALGLSRPAFVEKFGGSVRTIENNEGGRNEPGACLIGVLAANGINANWLLTGEGPMLIAELSTMARVDMLVAERNELAVSLQKALEKAWATAPQAPRLNVDVLASIIEGLLRTAPNAPPDKLGSVCASLYQDLIDKEMITPEGIGPGNQANAA